MCGPPEPLSLRHTLLLDTLLLDRTSPPQKPQGRPRDGPRRSIRSPRKMRLEKPHASPPDTHHTFLSRFDHAPLHHPRNPKDGLETAWRRPGDGLDGPFGPQGFCVSVRCHVSDDAFSDAIFPVVFASVVRDGRLFFRLYSFVVLDVPSLGVRELVRNKILRPL